MNTVNSECGGKVRRLKNYYYYYCCVCVGRSYKHHNASSTLALLTLTLTLPLPTFSVALYISILRRGHPCTKSSYTIYCTRTNTNNNGTALEDNLWKERRSTNQ